MAIFSTCAVWWSLSSRIMGRQYQRVRHHLGVARNDERRLRSDQFLVAAPCLPPNGAARSLTLASSADCIGVAEMSPMPQRASASQSVPPSGDRIHGRAKRAARAATPRSARRCSSTRRAQRVFSGDPFASSVGQCYPLCEPAAHHPVHHVDAHHAEAASAPTDTARNGAVTASAGFPISRLSRISGLTS